MTEREHRDLDTIGLWDSNGAAWKLALVMFVCFLVKCLLACVFPLLGDETYIALCAKRLAWGQYEHPPMMAWIVHWVLYLGRSPLLLRLPSLVFSALLGAGIYVLLKPYDQRKAYLASLLFLVAPFNLTFFFMTTDTALFLFSFLSASLLFAAENERRYAYYLLSGILLGMAFLSKYLAVMLGFSYALYFLSLRRRAHTTKAVLLLTLGGLPFVAQNVLWNYQNGWPNVMHNWVNRIGGDTNPVLNLLLLGIFLSYLATPPLVVYLFRSRAAVLQVLRHEKFRLFALICLVPVCVFIAASFKKRVGLHWYLSFLPFVFVVAALALDAKLILSCIRFSLVFSVIQSCVLLVIAFLPVGRLQGIVKEKDMASLVAQMYPRKLLMPLEQNRDNFVCATIGYADSAMLEFYGGQRVIVFGEGSHHARQDDILTDFKQLEGRNLLILGKVGSHREQYEPCFGRVEVKTLRIEGATFELILGYGFRYAEYREHYLRPVLNQYYQIPKWLPYSKSFFHQKYDF